MATQPKLTVRDIRRMHADGAPITVLTAYDAMFGRLADESGVDIVLVGDTLGMMVLGYPTTLQVTLDESLHHTRAVARGVQRALIVGDMPFMSFQVNDDETVRNAGRYIQEAGADAVKLEGGAERAPLVRRLVDSGIPVMGHVGLLPQQVYVEGAYRKHGKTADEAQRIADDAAALQEAGCFAIVLEGIDFELAARITAQLEVPTIGIGAGPDCSGQVQVMHDILGLFEDFVPKHTKRYANMADDARDAIKRYVDDVSKRRFP
jgi:3-methyl-2-oxobutanoate hydroxymethyltransferase